MQLEREIKGVKIGFRFGGSASVKFFNALEKFPDDLMINNTISNDGIAKLLQYTYENWCALNDKSVEYGGAFFADYVEGISDEVDELDFVKKVLDTWNESSTIKSLAKVGEKKSEAATT